MSPPLAGRLLAGIALAFCVLVGGCQSTSSLSSIIGHHGATDAKGDAKTAKAPTKGAPAKSAPAVVTKGMEIEWHVKTAHAAPNQIRAGRSVVAPDGKLEMGPYGACQIGGLTLPQATRALEKHLAKFMRGPSVTIAGQPPPAPAREVAWRPAGKGGVAPVAYQAPGEDVPLLPAPKGSPPPAVPAPATLGPATPGQPSTAMGLSHPVAASAPNECRPIVLPPYVIGPTDVLQIESLEELATQKVLGPHLVGPDGTVRVGIYGAVLVAGLTLDQAKVALAQTISARLSDKIGYDKVYKGLSVDVLAYNAKVYYIVTDGGGQGDTVVSLPMTGRDMVLDALAKVNGLPVIGSKHKIWVARKNCPGCEPMILGVDWIGVTKRGEGVTNWQIMPGDRVYVQADPFYAADRHLAKWLGPVERLFGAALLGSQTVNSITSGGVGGAPGVR